MNQIICILICFLVGLLIYSLINSYCSCNVVEGQSKTEMECIINLCRNNKIKIIETKCDNNTIDDILVDGCKEYDLGICHRASNKNLCPSTPAPAPPTPPSTKFSCSGPPHFVCNPDPSGTLTQEACMNQCKDLYSCSGPPHYVCNPDSSGTLTQEECRDKCKSAPPSTKFSCSGPPHFVCNPDPSGTLTQEECRDKCKDLYSCSGPPHYVCNPDSSGTQTQEECRDKCKSAPPSTKFSCSGPPHYVCNPDSSGTQTQEECRDKCKSAPAPAPPTQYSCDNSCTFPVTNGSYSSQSLCYSGCGISLPTCSNDTGPNLNKPSDFSCPNGYTLHAGPGEYCSSSIPCYNGTCQDNGTCPPATRFPKVAELSPVSASILDNLLDEYS